MMRFRRYCIELYRELGVFARVGSVRIASSAESLLELRRAASRAAGIGLDARADLARARCSSCCPYADGDPIHGGVWMPGDGHVDPHIATHARRRRGARARRRDPRCTRASAAIELGADGARARRC